MVGVEFIQKQRIILDQSFNFIHMKISLELLQILDAIDRHGSFTAAAAALHRVPSALSHAVSKLEDDLDLRLFDRQGRKATLNEAGRTLLDDGRQLLHAASELERRVQRIANGWEAELRIAVDAIIPIERLFPLLERFYGTACSTRIRLATEVLGGSWDALATGRADLVIGAPGDPPARGGIGSRQLCRARMRLVVAPDHPLAQARAPVTTADLAQHRAVVIADTSQELDARTVGVLEGQDVLRVPDIRAKASAQAAGLGIGHLPRWLADPEIAAGRLLPLALAEPRPALDLSIAWHNRQVGKGLAWFLDALADPAVIATVTGGI